MALPLSLLVRQPPSLAPTSRAVRLTRSPTTANSLSRPVLATPSNLTGFAFDFAVEAPLPLGSKTSSFQLQYSLNGGSNFTVAPTPTVSGIANTVTNVPSRNSTPSIDSTATYDLSSLGPVGGRQRLCRIYVSGSVAGDTTNIQRYDNFNVTGDVAAIPEPATWALLAFSLTTVMVLRRRRNS